MSIRLMTAPASMYIAEGRAEIIIADGDILAMRQRGRVEVWTASSETHMGNLPIDATEAQIRDALRFWQHGFLSGATLSETTPHA